MFATSAAAVASARPIIVLPGTLTRAAVSAVRLVWARLILAASKPPDRPEMRDVNLNIFSSSFSCPVFCF